jgi:lipopolysaccharide biosynthesis glycosyltransferase
MDDDAPLYPVVFSSDDAFVPYMAALVRSIMDNAVRRARYRFFVLHRGIAEENRRLLRAMTESGVLTGNGGAGPVFSTVFVDVAAHIEGYRFYRTYLPVESYFRLLIPWLFEYKKVLYLDSDMICRADLADLFAVELNGNLVAACRDDFIAGNRGRYHARAIGFDSNRDYFNAGMLLMNTEAFRASASMKELLNLAVSRDWQFCDQDVLNVFCRGRVMLLNMEWNAMITMHNEEQFPPDLREEYRRSRAHPKIVHFAGPKPWDSPPGGWGWAAPEREAQMELFLRYASRTPFRR